MAKKRTLIIVAVVAVIAGVAYWRFNPSEPAGTPPAPPTPEAARVGSRELRFPSGSQQLSFIKSQAIEALPEPLLDPLNARIAYDENRTARISSSINGRVIRIMVQPGENVKAGQPLITLDAPDFAAASADLSKANADLQLKQQAFARSKELLDAGVIARKDFESSEADLHQSQAEGTRARLRLHNLTGGPSSGGDGSYSMHAPISGVLTERNVNPGSEVRPDAAAPLFVITDPTHLWVMVDLPERNITAMRVGQEASVEVDAYPGKIFNAKVVSVGDVLDPATRRVQVRCSVDNPDRMLKPEMYARVTPHAAGQARLPRVPNSSLLTEGLYSFVFVEKSPGAFEKRQVTLGLQGKDTSYVRQGLKEGERVVTQGALLLNSELTGI